MPKSQGVEQGGGLHLIIIGGGSVEYGLGPYIDRHVVVRMKGAKRDPIHSGMRMDIYFARGPHSLSKEAAVFWRFPKRTPEEEHWLAFYRRYSGAKPSAGLCCLLMASKYCVGQTVGLLGFDRLLDGIPMDGPHSFPDESRAARALPLTLIDLRTQDGQALLCGA